MSLSGAPHPAHRRLRRTLALACVAFAVGVTVASADEAGISFWVPGTYGALAAAPLPPGFSIAEIYYHSPIKGGGDVAIARQVPIAGVTTKVPSTLEIHIGVQNDLLLSIPSYVFASPVLGLEQLQIGMLIPYGRNKVSVDQTIIGPTGTLGGPPMTGSASGIGDFEPQVSLRWNFGVHNFMIYGTGDVPDRALQCAFARRTSATGTGRSTAAPATPISTTRPDMNFPPCSASPTISPTPRPSIRTGSTCISTGACRDFSPKTSISERPAISTIRCLAITDSSHQLGCFESHVLGIGPQATYVIPLGNLQGALNVKWYKDFDWAHRAHGWSGWLTFVLSNAPTNSRHTPTHR